MLEPFGHCGHFGDGAGVEHAFHRAAVRMAADNDVANTEGHDGELNRRHFAAACRAVSRDEVAGVAEDEEIAALDPDAHGLTVLPFWSGERSTGWHADARGGIFGLTQTTTPAEIARAVLESISYRFALIARALNTLAPEAMIVASGNALRSSPGWLQIMADVLGRPLSLGGSAEASSRGAALLALEAVGKIATIEQDLFAVEKVFEPDLMRHARYQQGLARQVELYDRVFKA